MLHDNILRITPILDINMARPFGGDTFVNHIDSQGDVFIKQSGTVLWLSDFQKDSTKVFTMLCSCNSSKKLGFRTVGEVLCCLTLIPM